MNWVCVGDQNQGNRHRQEDRWDIFRQRNRLLAVVADGMGGMPLGDAAAEEAVETSGATFREKKLHMEDPAKVLIAAVTKADRAVWEMAAREGLAGSVGTTLVAVLAEGRWAWWVSVGDSRVYLFRKGVLRQLSRDHTVGEELREARRGGASPERDPLFWSSPEAITSFIGIGGLEKVSQPESPLHAEKGDRLLLASDGLFNTLSSEKILACLEGSPENPARALV
ncbi:MAG: PP2C family protein-serine/threonine phosphatase, partial [Thermovirgaceae bacterium]